MEKSNLLKKTMKLLTLDENLIVVPGFIDKHIHGANNSDSMYPTQKDIANIAKTIASEGVNLLFFQQP